MVTPIGHALQHVSTMHIQALLQTKRKERIDLRLSDTQSQVCVIGIDVSP